MEKQHVREEITKLIQWNRPEVRILTINLDTEEIKAGSGPDLLDKE